PREPLEGLVRVADGGVEAGEPVAREQVPVGRVEKSARGGERLGAPARPGQEDRDLARPLQLRRVRPAAYLLDRLVHQALLRELRGDHPAGETVVRVAGHGFAELDERLVVAPGEVENEARVRADLGRAGVDAARFPHFPQGIIGASLGDEREGVTLPGAGRARIERDRAAALALRAAPVPLEEELLEAERAVRWGE